MTTTMPARPTPFERFHAAHRVGVLRLLVGMVGPDAALDCSQETWLKVLRAWPPEDPDGRLDSWVLTIAHRTALDALRRRGRELPLAELPERAVDGDDGPAPPLGELGPSELWDHVRALPDRRRAAVVLRTVLDMSHAQAAVVLDCTEAAARRSYADGIAALRRTTEAHR